ncbi:MAG: hypothetical protein ACTSP2_06255 [Alphaproteobacteria bacterium]
MYADIAQTPLAPVRTAPATTKPLRLLSRLMAAFARGPRHAAADQLTSHLLADLNLQRRDVDLPYRSSPPLDPRLTTLF